MHHLELHPLCSLFPRITGAEFDSLRDDIAANGLRQPITTHNGMILDGGNRYRACIEAGVEPILIEFAGGNLVSFVLSQNMHRRHLSAGQQAAIVASAQDWSKAQPAGGDRRSDQSATLHLETVADRAAQSGASERTQKMADKVARQDPALARQVAHGEISLPKAHEQVSTPLPKILPRRESNDPATAPAALPTGSSATPPKSIAELEADNAQLRVENEDLRTSNEEMAALLEGVTYADEGAEAAAKKIAELVTQLRTVESQRDGYMLTGNEMKREIASLRRQLTKVKGATSK